MIIFTHINLDLDAASSAALAYIINKDKHEDIVFRFMSADTTEREFIENSHGLQNYLILDVECGSLGMKGEVVVEQDKTYVLSAFSSYLHTCPESYIKAFDKLACYIDAIDSHIREVNDLSFLDTFRAFKHGTGSDEELLEIWIKFLEGYYKNFYVYDKALREEVISNWVYSNIVITPKESEILTAKLLTNKGADFVVYEDGNNMGIVIADRVPRATAEALGRALPGWFVHRGGFLVAWGTKKAPKTTPSGYTTKEIAKLINEVYND